MMSERIWEKWKFRIGVRGVWIEKHGRELLGRPKLIKGCSAKSRRRRRRCTAASTVCLHGVDTDNCISETHSWNPTLSTVMKLTVFIFTCSFPAELR